jgi:hypothetical protein
MPLPNLYDDCHLCTGSSFNAESFRDPMKHQGIVESLNTYVEYWADTFWNLDLLGGSNTQMMKQYLRFVQFDPSTGKSLPFNGCADWATGTSSVPLERLFRPWIVGGPAVKPTIPADEANLPAGGDVEPEPMRDGGPEPE